MLYYLIRVFLSILKHYIRQYLPVSLKSWPFPEHKRMKNIPEKQISFVRAVIVATSILMIVDEFYRKGRVPELNTSAQMQMKETIR